jgi:Cdc6-like AAA superfamily ATPase
MTDLKDTLRLAVEDLTWMPPQEGIFPSSTAEVEPREGIIGQDRAVKAITRGLAVKSAGFNIFVVGANGTGRTDTVLRLLDEFNQSGPIPQDLCYVNNFKNTDQPRLLVFEAGHGAVFKREMNDVVNSLKKKIPAVFESEEFQAARNEIINQHMGAQKALFKNFEN